MRYYRECDFSVLSRIPLQPRPAGRRVNSRKWKYKDIVCAFDIEATNMTEERQAVMYIWQFALDTDVYYGRTWDEFLDFLRRLGENIKDGERLCVFIHNASYEFQFVSGIYPFRADEVFAMERRKILWFTMYGKFEFRCSYLQTGMNLRKFLVKMGVPDQKLEMDYAAERYPWTEMNEGDLAYCENDVKGLTEAMKKKMSMDKDNLYTIPMTSTGYVRRDAKKALRAVNRNMLLRVQPSLPVYTLLREAFRGGNTHANRIFVGDVLEDVYSSDIVSSYPTVMMECTFPTKFYKADKVTQDDILFQRQAWIARFSFRNIRLHDRRMGAPYLSLSKCRNLGTYLEDNGRVLWAERLDTTLTEIDFRIVFRDYDFDEVRITDAYHASKKLLPLSFRNVISEYFDAKTRLKGVDAYYYARAKEMLNSLYGMAAQNPVKDDVVYENGEFRVEDANYGKTLEKNGRKAFLPYQVGVWVTAYARLRLQQAIWNAGYRFVYCDTDSVKTVGKMDLSGINEQAVQRAKSAGAFSAKADGTPVYMGVFEQDGHYDKFRTWGAKKYCVVENGKLKATIAGVSKALAPDELGCIENFAPPFEFKAAGGVGAVFNDMKEPMTLWKDGRELTVTSNIYLYQDTYRLSLTDDYSALLENVEAWTMLMKDIHGKIRLKKEMEEYAE